MQDRKRPRSSDDKFLQFRRLLSLERFEPRLLLAADLQSNELGFIPKEPLELLLADQAHYGSDRGGNGTLNGTGELIPLLNTFQLHSRPSATKTIYLDFDGFTARGTSWNFSRDRDPIISPAWDPDGDGPAFSDNELLRIQGIWQRVAADFAPFEVNVTTQDPGEADLVQDGLGDTRWGIRVVFTPDDFPGPGSGGVAYINSFSWGYGSDGATDTPCYVFNMSEVAAAAAASHEVGHALGLSHDGTTSAHPTQPTAAYYEGHGSGENSWGPIMGVGGYYRNVTTWDDGTYFAANNGTAGANYGSGPDDLQIITNENGFGYVPDPEANFINIAMPLATDGDFGGGLANFNQFGVISESTDIDFFSFQTGTGTLNLTIDPYVTETWVRQEDGSFVRSVETAYFDGNIWSQNQGANLDIRATLYDANANVIATSDPEGLRARFTDLQLTAGRYYVSIEGTGFGTPTANPPVGYSDYGSIGQYLITGTAPVALGIQTTNQTVTYIEDTPPVQVASSVSLIDGIPGDYSNGVLAVSITPAPASTDRIGLAAAPGLSVTGRSISENGLQIAIFSQPSPATLNINLNRNATLASIEKLVHSVTFQATGDAPSTSTRNINFRLSKGAFSAFSEVAVNVIPTNDPPSMQSAMMASIPEDTTAPAGQSIGSIFANALTDPDPGDSLSGIAIVGNNTPVSQGVWQFSVNASDTWRPLGVTSLSNRLVLSANARLRFLPAEDFFGVVDPLRVQAIDRTYAGPFSTAATLVYLPASTPNSSSSFAVAASNLAIEITPVNDAPRAQLGQLRFVATQEQLLVATIPLNAFSDVENNPLTYSATLANGLPLPNWLRLNAAAATFSGTPRSLDVIQLDILLNATDTGGLSATIPVIIDVININDPPSNLRISNSVIAENTSDASVGRLTAFDPDGDTIVWTSSDPRFAVRDSEVFVVEALDYETIPQHQILVTFTALDSGSPTLSASLDVSIKVTDINEYIPTLESQIFSIPDGAAAGTLLARLQAIDNDTAQVVKYRLHSGSTSAFTINELTGELRLANLADFDSLASYKVFVEAYDNGSPSFKSVAQFIVDVEPQNLVAPIINERQTFRFSENLVGGTNVGQILAADADDTPLIYSLVSVEGGSNAWIQVDPRTGVVSLTSANQFDFEAGVEYALNVLVTEDAPEARSTTARIPIVLLDANDPPTAVGPLIVYPQRQGVEATSDFVIEDQDPAANGYTVTTTDSRFEVRNGILALRPNQAFTSSQVGTVFTVSVFIADKDDPNSTATLDVNVLVKAAATWQNPVNRFDVNRDGNVSALDVLLVINQLNTDGGTRTLPALRTFDQLSAMDVDTSGDNFLSPLDALQIVNFLNVRALEGEIKYPSPPTASINFVESDLWFLAFSEIEAETARRRLTF